MDVLVNDYLMSATCKEEMVFFYETMCTKYNKKGYSNHRDAKDGTYMEFRYKWDFIQATVKNEGKERRIWDKELGQVCVPTDDAQKYAVDRRTIFYIIKF